MDFPFRYLYLVLGLLLLAVSLPVFYRALKGEWEGLKMDPAQRLFISLTGLTFALILLRLAYVMFVGPGRSEVF